MTLLSLERLKSILTRTRNRAQKRGFSIDIDLEYLRDLWAEQGGCCAVSGLEFSEEFHEDVFVTTPFAPSLDRIDSSQGYVRGNVRLVTTIANFAMGQWGDTVLRRLAHGVVETERKTHQAWFRQQRRKLKNAEKLALTLSGKELEKQKRVIASLKRTITMGPARTSGAAYVANQRKKT